MTAFKSKYFKYNIPAVFHPTQILAIDDDELLLQTLGLSLRKKRKLLTFTEPTTALNYLSDYDRCYPIKTFVDDKPTTLAKHLHQPERFQQIAVVMSDYHMPKQDGVTFFQNLDKSTQQAFKRILFTSITKADIEAIKTSTHIDIELSKTDMVTKIGKLLNILQQLETDFFTDVYDMSDAVPILKQRNYIDLVNRIITENRIVEGYLLDTTGTYLFIDNNSKCFTLSILDDLGNTPVLGEAYSLVPLKNSEYNNGIYTFKKYLHTSI